MRGLVSTFRREAGAYFASPVAYLFIGTFLAVTLFIFFWVEAFFARNIADVRPLFEWMPILLIALVSALTMRAWSEERRAGTLEVLMTAPVSSTALVLGKFFAALSLIAVALLLTLPLPITADMLGPLDWGPVIGGYVATLFLAGAYVAVGLFVSARSENQIVSLIVTALIGVAFYLVGSDWLTGLAPAALADVMRWLGTGSRFDELARGMLDLRDIYYYVSLTGLFLAANVYALESLRWGRNSRGRHRAWRTAVVLIAVNFLIANVWLQPVAMARADVTADNRFSLSEGTRLTLASLTEPLIIRGYFSRNTHPLLAPLVPQMRDLLHEYAVVGGNRVKLSTVFPEEQPEAMAKARREYGIEPVPVQTASRYQTSVVNSYFHVLVRYGDQYKVLGYQDLMAFKGSPGLGIKVSLKNPEYQVTKAIREVVRQWRSEGNLFHELEAPVVFHGYISGPKQLPDALADARQALQTTLDKFKDKAGGMLKVEFQEPAAGDGSLAKQLGEEFGFRPMTTSLLSRDTFYFYMVLQQGGQTVPVPLPANFEPKDFHDALEAGLEHFVPGLRNTVAVYRHTQTNRRLRSMFGGHQYRKLMDVLKANMDVVRTDLKKGTVPADADLFLVIGPQKLGAKQRFAIDQFLMRGGTVIIAASPLTVKVSQYSGVQVSNNKTGLAGWLAGYGVDIGDALVVDPQSGSLTLPTVGPGGDMMLRTMKYPYFVDVRDDGLADIPMLGGLHQITMAWVSPVTVDQKEAAHLQVTKLIHSSPQSWTTSNGTVMPDYQQYPGLGFAPPAKRGPQTLAVMLQGRFTSAFKGKDSPLKTAPPENADKTSVPDTQDKSKDKKPAPTPQVTTVIDHSPANARLVVFGSANFLSDTALGIIAGSINSGYTRPAKLVQNVIDWSLEDPALLAMRGQTHYTRLLRPLSDSARMVAETSNYAAALGGLLLVFVLRRGWAERRRRQFKNLLRGLA